MKVRIIKRGDGVYFPQAKGFRWKNLSKHEPFSNFCQMGEVPEHLSLCLEYLTAARVVEEFKEKRNSYLLQKEQEKRLEVVWEGEV
jgi:hypothetical protein